jgi:hypothetical protein
LLVLAAGEGHASRIALREYRHKTFNTTNRFGPRYFAALFLLAFLLFFVFVTASIEKPLGEMPPGRRQVFSPGAPVFRS